MTCTQIAPQKANFKRKRNQILYPKKLDRPQPRPRPRVTSHESRATSLSFLSFFEFVFLCTSGQRPAAFDSGLKPELDLTLIRGLNLKSEETYSTINLNQGTRTKASGSGEAEDRKRKQNENLLPLFSLFLLSSFPEEKKKDTRTQ